MNNSIKAVIFDWGGVVAPNKNGGWVMQLSILLDIDFDTALQLWRECSPGLSTNQITEDDFWLLVRRKIGKAPPEQKSNIWKEGLASKPYPAIINLVRNLKERGIKTVVLSNTIEPMERIFDFNNMYSDFDLAVLSHREGVAKPKPSIYKIVLERLGLKADECIFIDDVQNNLDSAKILGFEIIHSDHNPDKTINEIYNFVT
jgi:putative hydrolase of the HAD superfamily